ncbi:MAG TPA: phosphate acyltransferase PlsX [Catalimonadaceae bacterium]|nr:phosphate acyltransferase PlsX [Catalimonadaceae bacterium]
MTIALDAMGGDFAPQAAVEGAVLAHRELKDNCELLLVGDRPAIERELSRLNVSPDTFSIHHSPDVIEMGDHPAKAFSQKPESSIAVGFQLLKSGEAQAFCSAGNTGAMMVGAMFTVKALPGIIRPAIMGYLPKEDGRVGALVDIGANADCKPEQLNQFAEMGAIYAECILDIPNPKIGLLNLGEEEQKGSILTQAAYQLLKVNSNINFIGNVEGRDIFNDKADVIVCDGFVGNVVTKMAEHFYEILHSRKVNDEFVNNLNYEVVGGSPIVGVDGNVVIGHGVSSPLAIKNMILVAQKMITSDMLLQLKSALAKSLASS